MQSKVFSFSQDIFCAVSKQQQSDQCILFLSSTLLAPPPPFFLPIASVGFLDGACWSASACNVTGRCLIVAAPCLAHVSTWQGRDLNPDPGPSGHHSRTLNAQPLPCHPCPSLIFPFAGFSNHSIKALPTHLLWHTEAARDCCTHPCFPSSCTGKQQCLSSRPPAPPWPCFRTSLVNINTHKRTPNNTCDAYNVISEW